MKIFCGICDGTMELVWSGQAGDKWRCPNCDHEVDLPFGNPNGWIQPVAPDCPLDGHSHEPGTFCRGCADLTGWTPPIFAVEPKTQADRENAGTFVCYSNHAEHCTQCAAVDERRGGSRCPTGAQLLRYQNNARVALATDRKPLLDKEGRRLYVPKDYGTFEENLTALDEKFLESLRVGWK